MEIQQLGFVPCHFQAKLCQSLRQSLIKALCITNQLKATHKVARIAAQCGVTSAMSFNLKKSVELNPAENIQHKFDKQIGGMS